MSPDLAQSCASDALALPTEAHLAAILAQRADLSDAALTDLMARSRVAGMWAWIRLGRPTSPPAGPLGAALRDRLVEELAADARLRVVLEGLSRAGIEPLLLKGAGLAHDIYPMPWLRPRADEDLLVPRATFAAACDVIGSLGYAHIPSNPDAEETGQAHFTRIFRDGSCHHIDLHWRPLIPRAFTDLPDYDALRRSARPLPALGTGAWQSSLAHALVLACAHRVAHHTADEDPIWLLDVHLLASRLDETDWDTVVETARSGRVTAICAAELSVASAQLDTRVPSDVQRRLGAMRGEPSARYLHARSRLHRVWLDLMDRPDRWHAVRSRVWPSRAYMRWKYGRSDVWLPALYLWRLGAGAAGWLAEAIRRMRMR